MSSTVYLPATADRPAEPAPYLLTGDEAARLLRLTSADHYETMRRYRRMGWLKATQIGKQVRYALPDVLKFIETARESNPR